jgi:hypothetical protein
MSSAMESKAKAEGPRRRGRGKRRVSIRRDIEWVYCRLDGTDEPQRAPSAGARALLKWARANTDEFVQTFLPKMLPTKREMEAEDQKDSQAVEPQMAFLEEFIANFQEEMRQKDAELAKRPDAAQIGATLQAAITSCLERERVLLTEVNDLKAELQAARNQSLAPA